MAWLYIRWNSIWAPTFAHAFGSVLWGVSALLFPETHELGGWAVLQIVQLTRT
jgi:hypothetical protein